MSTMLFSTTFVSKFDSISGQGTLRKMTINLKNHKVWPLRLHSKDGRTGPFASSIFIEVNSRPWAFLNTFEKPAKLCIFPIKSRFLDEDIKRSLAAAITNDPEVQADDLEEALLLHLHVENLEVLTRRWSELSRANRNYVGSRYYASNVQDITYRWVKQEHMERLITEGQRSLMSANARYRDLTAELAALRADMEVLTTGQSVGLTHKGRRQLLLENQIKSAMSSGVDPLTMPERKPTDRSYGTPPVEPVQVQPSAPAFDPEWDEEPRPEPTLEEKTRTLTVLYHRSLNQFRDFERNALKMLPQCWDRITSGNRENTNVHNIEFDWMEHEHLLKLADGRYNTHRQTLEDLEALGPLPEDMSRPITPDMWSYDEFKAMQNVVAYLASNVEGLSGDEEYYALAVEQLEKAKARLTKQEEKSST